MQTSGPSAAYQAWAEAEEAASGFERAIFREGHALTSQEQSCLKDLRGTAAMRLSQLIGDIDTELDRLRPHGEAPHATDTPATATPSP